MTINTNDVRNEYTAGAAQTIFNYTFKIYTNTDLNVYVTTAGQVCVPGDLTTAYTVAGVGLEVGGTITLTTPTTNNDLVTIVSSIPDNRTTDYQNNGDFRPDTVNDDFDRVVSLVKQNNDKVDRTLAFEECEQGVSGLTLPAPVASTFWRMKSDLSGMENFTFSSTGIVAEVSVANYVALKGLTSTGFTDGQVIFVTNDGLAGEFTVKTGTISDNGGTRFPFDDDSNRFAERTVNSKEIHARWFGVDGDNSGSPYTTELTNVFAFTSADAKEIIFPNETITFNNSGGSLSFQSDVTYSGGPKTFFQITDDTQRCFATASKNNFQFINMRVLGTEVAGDAETAIGGGYFRFDLCNGFFGHQSGASNSFGGGIKIQDCNDFVLRDIECNFNQQTGIEIKGSKRYLVENWTCNGNGRYSATNLFKPLRTGLTSHTGRAITVEGNGSNVDQDFAVIGTGRGIDNSEYGFRVVAFNTMAPTNLRLNGPIYFKDSGAPAGTYGPATTPVDKGVDFLINSDPIGESDNIWWSDVTIDRTVDFGTSVQVDGNNHKQTRTQVNHSGSALHINAACAIFGGDNFISEQFESNGCAIHLSYGSGLPTNVTFRGDRGIDCLKAFNSGPNSGVNTIENCVFEHRSTPAVSGEHGIQLSTEQINIHNTTFDGFFRGIEVITASPKARVTSCTTTNTVDSNSGLRATTVTTQTNLRMQDNNFDTANPGMMSTFTYSGEGALGRRRHIWNAIPTSGTNAGSALNWATGDRVENSGVGVDGNNMYVDGWLCTVAGTPGTWITIYISTVTPAT